MTSFYPILIQCPYCKQKMFDYELSSYAVYHSTLFSDGKSSQNIGFTADQTIKICASCEQPFWVEQIAVDEEKLYQLRDSLPQAKSISDLPFMLNEKFPEELIKYYEKLLNTGFAGNSEKKYFLRIRIWWAINDLIRYRTNLFGLIRGTRKFNNLWSHFKNRRLQRQSFQSFTPLFINNLRELILLTIPIHEDDYIMLAEMYREIGQFNKARKSLNQVSDQNSSVVKKLKRKILLRQKKVIKL
jgi:hypothetical protein